MGLYGDWNLYFLVRVCTSYAYIPNCSEQVLMRVPAIFFQLQYGCMFQTAMWRIHGFSSFGMIVRILTWIQVRAPQHFMYVLFIRKLMIRFSYCTVTDGKSRILCRPESYKTGVNLRLKMVPQKVRLLLSIQFKLN